MTRRGIRLTRKAGTTVTAGAYVLLPSGVSLLGNPGTITVPSGTTMTVGGWGIPGVTISGSGVTLGNPPTYIDYGQGTAYKMYRGAEPVSMNAPTLGTRLSDGTVQFTTGLNTMVSLEWSLEYSGASMLHVGFPMDVWYTTGYTNVDSGVTFFLYTTHWNSGTISACTPGSSSWSGTTIHWIAVGT